MATDKTEDLPCDDEEYARGIEYLSKHCAAFQRYRRETTEKEYLLPEETEKFEEFLTDVFQTGGLAPISAERWIRFLSGKLRDHRQRKELEDLKKACTEKGVKP